MLEATRTTLLSIEDGPKQFEASEKHSGIDYLLLPNTEDTSVIAFSCFSAGTIDPLPDAKLSLPSIRFYFTRVFDKDGNLLVGVKQAAFFKSIVRTKGLMRFFDDSLRLIEGPLFQLDHDFDFLINSEYLHILRPRQFIQVCELQKELLRAAPKNVAEISQHLPMFDFSGVLAAASSKSTIANLVASINAQGFMKGINLDKLRIRCAASGVAFNEVNGVISIDNDHIATFLEILDRRRYEFDLAEGDSENWVAGSRKRAPKIMASQ